MEVTKTGGPSSSFIKTGTSLLRNMGYVCPLHKSSTLSLSSIATFSFTCVSRDGSASSRSSCSHVRRASIFEVVLRVESLSLAAKASTLWAAILMIDRPRSAYWQGVNYLRAPQRLGKKAILPEIASRPFCVRFTSMGAGHRGSRIGASSLP